MAKRTLLGAVLLPTVVFALVAPPIGGTNATAAVESVADSQGKLRLPADYRRRYEFLGSWAIASESGGGSKEMHAVYASPGTASVYRKTGKFPEDAVLVKEVFEATTSAMTTGAAVSHAETLKGWFVMVKDGAGVHAGQPLWGDGWGWFDAGNPKVTTSKSYVTDCRARHVPASASERVYIQGYPPLRR
jgi:hypothetical protein